MRRIYEFIHSYGGLGFPRQKNASLAAGGTSTAAAAATISRCLLLVIRALPACVLGGQRYHVTRAKSRLRGIKKSFLFPSLFSRELRLSSVLPSLGSESYSRPCLPARKNHPAIRRSREGARQIEASRTKKEARAAVKASGAAAAIDGAWGDVCARLGELYCMQMSELCFTQ